MTEKISFQGSFRQKGKKILLRVRQFFLEPFCEESFPQVPWSTKDAVVVVIASTILFSLIIFGGFYGGVALIDAGMIETPGLLSELGLEITTKQALEMKIIDGHAVMSIFLFKHLSIAVMAGIFFQVFLQLILLYAYSHWKYGIRMTELGFRTLPAKMLFLMVIMLFTLSVVIQNGILSLYHVFGIEDAAAHGAAEQLITDGIIPLPILFLFAGLVAPIMEEVIFRGFFLAGKLKRSRAFSALSVSALFFALAHLNPTNLFPGLGGDATPFALPTLDMLASAMVLMPIYFLLGMLLGFSFLKTRSLYPGITFHMVNNTAALLLLLR